MDEERKKSALIHWINGFDLGQNLQNLSQLRDGKHFNAILKYLNASHPQTKLKATCWQRTLRTYLEGYYQVNFDGKIDFNAAFKGDESELIKICSYLLCTSLAGPKNSTVMNFLTNFDLSTQNVIKSIIEIVMKESDILNFNIMQAAKSCNAVTPTSSPIQATFNSRSSPICQLLQSPNDKHKVAIREKNELIKKLVTELQYEKEIRIDFENEASACRTDAEETNKNLEKLSKDYFSAKLKIGELELKIQQHQYLIDEKTNCLKRLENNYKKQEEKLLEHESLKAQLTETEEENLMMKTKLEKLEEADKKSSHGNNLLCQLELANEDLKRKLSIKMEEVVHCKKLLKDCEFEAKRMKEMFLDKEEALRRSPEIPEVGERLSTIIELELKASQEEIQQLRTDLEIKNENIKQLIKEHELKTTIMNKKKLKLENQLDEILKEIEERKIASIKEQSAVQSLRKENQDALAKADQYLQQQTEIHAKYDIRLTSVHSELLESKKCFEMKSEELLLAQKEVKVSEGKIEELAMILKTHQEDKIRTETALNKYKLKYENSSEENVKLFETLSELKKSNSNLLAEIDKTKSDYCLLETTTESTVKDLKLDFSRQMDELKEKINMLKHQLLDQTKMSDNLQFSLNETTSELMNCKNCVQISHDELHMAEKELVIREERIQKLELTMNEYLEAKLKTDSELGDYHSKIQSLNKEIVALVNARSHLENVNSNLQDQINDQKSQHTLLEETTQSILKDAERIYTGKIIELNQKIEEFQKQVLDKTELGDHLQLQLNATSSELIDCQSRFETNFQKLQLAEKELAEREEKILKFELTLNDYLEEKIKTENELSDCQSKFQSLNEEIVVLVNARSHLENANSNLQDQINDQKSQYTSLEKAMELSLKDSESDYTGKIIKLNLKVEEFQKQILDKTEISDNLQLRLNEISSELMDCKNCVQISREELNGAEKELLIREERIKKLELTMNEYLEEKVETENELSDCKSKIKSLNEENAVLVNARSHLENANSNLQDQINDQKSQYTLLENAMELSLKDSESNYTGKIIELNQKVEEIQKQVLDKTELSDHLQLRLNETSSELMDCRNRFETNFQKLQLTEKDLAMREEKIQKFELTLNDYLEEKVKTKNELSDCQSKFQSLNEENAVLVNARSHLENANSNLQDQINDQKSQYTSLEKAMELSLKDAESDYTGKIIKLNQKVEEFQKQILDKTEINDNLQLRLNEISSELMDCKNCVQISRDELHGAEKELVRREERIKKLELTMNEYLEEKVETENELSDCQSKIQSLNEENAVLVGKIIELNQKVEEFQKQILDKTEISDNFQLRLNEISSEIMNCKNCFEVKNEELRVAENEINLLNGQLEEAHAISVKRLEEIMHIKAMCCELENKNIILQNSLAKAETEWNGTRSECDSIKELQIQLNVEIEKLKNANEILTNQNLNYVTMINDVKQQLADVQARCNDGKAVLQKECQIRLSVESALENSLQEKKRFESEISCLSEKLTNLSSSYSVCQEQNSSLTEKIASVESECCFLKMKLKEVVERQEIEDNELQKQKSIYEENLASLTNELELNKCLYKEELEKLICHNQTLSSDVQKLEEDNAVNGKESLEWKNKYQFLIKQNVKEINKLREDYERKLLESKNNKELQQQIMQLQQQVLTSEEKHCQAINMLTTMNENLKDESTRHSLYYENLRLELTTKDKIIAQLKRQTSENQFIVNQDCRETITLSRSMGKTHSQASLPAFANESTNNDQSMSMTKTNIGRQSFSMTNLMPSSKLSDYGQSRENLFDRTLSTIQQNSFACRLPGSARQWVACEDEEGEFHNVSYLQDLKRGEMRSDDGRLDELQRRNTLCLPHLRTSYPLETVLSSVNFKEEDFKSGKINIPKVEPPWQGADRTRIISAISNENLQPLDEPSERRKTKVIQPNYHKPGPPTPGKSSKTQDLNHGKRTPNSVRNLFKRPSLTPKSYAKYKVASPKRDNNENNPPSTYIQVMHKIPIKKNTAFDIGFSPKVKKTKAVFKKSLQVTSTPLAKRNLN